MENTSKIEISMSTLLKVALGIFLVWFLYAARDVFVLFFISVILAAALEPWVDKWESKRMPRSFAVFLVYLVLLSAFSLLFYFLIPSLFGQVGQMVNNLPAYENKLEVFTNWINQNSGALDISVSAKEILNNFGDTISTSGGKLFTGALGIFEGFIAVVIVLAMTFYMLVIKDGMKNFLISVFPHKSHDYAVSLYDRIKKKIGNWMAGQLVVMLIVFLIYFTILYLLNIPYALIIALIGGILEIVPYIGPIIAGVLAAALALLESPAQALLVLASYTVAHQLEAHFIVPKIMQRAVGLNPVTVILALLIGLKLAGVLGAILAIPTATALGLALQDFLGKK